MSLTPEQLLQRKRTLGASEIAAVCGLSPWQSAHDVWLDKLGLSDSVGNKRTRVGDLMEPVVLQMYKEDTGYLVAHFGTVTHPRRSWMSATPDFAVYGIPRVGEIKCVGARLMHHWTDEDDGVPDYVRTQGEWQCEVTGAEGCDFAALIGGTDFRIYRIKRDPELAGMLVEQGERFWHDHVLTGVPPAVDHSDGARRMLTKLYPNHSKPLKAATDEAQATVDALLVAKESFAAVERKKNALENRLRELIADAEGIRGNGFVATYRSDKNGRRNLKVTAKEAA